MRARPGSGQLTASPLVLGIGHPPLPTVSSYCLLGWAFLMVQMVKNLPAMQETWIRFLGWEDPLEKGMATCSNILAWRIPWTEEP